MDERLNVPLDDLRLQYDRTPYPNTSLERSHGLDSRWLHSFVTPYYRRNRRLPPERCLNILDAGCGSGYTTLALAQANPGAVVTGIDISGESLKIAAERLAHHGFEQAHFRVLPVERVAELGLLFDYINCDEVLYLLPDPAAGLAALASVLAPGGILRANLHSAIARASVFRAQKVFRLLGITTSTPGPGEMELVRQAMNDLNHSTYLKIETWMPNVHMHEDLEWYQLNYLLQGDKGFTVPETFQMLEGAGLEFISMTLWPTWEVACLFQDPGNLPPLLEHLKQMTTEERLHLYELIHGCHRLIDFWCGHRGETMPATVPPEDWDDRTWQAARIHLHPQLRTAELAAALDSAEHFQLQHYIHYPYGEPLPGPQMSRTLLALQEGPLDWGEFECRWRGEAESSSHDPVPTAREFLVAAHALGYLLIELVRHE